MVSSSKTFEGIRGLDNLSGLSTMQQEASKKVQPKPGTWIQTAAVSWLNQNDTADIANQLDISQAFSKADSMEVQKIDS